MKFSVVTLGCDKNTVDSERYIAELTAHGAERTSMLDEAEVIVVNTCGFIDAAKAESLDAILDAARRKDGGACRMVAAVGCMIERHKSELVDALPEVDLFLGTTEAERLIPELEARGFLDDAPLLQHPGVRVYAGDHPHIRYLKISEGCDHGCAFCAIPLMRGKHRSFALGDVVREAQLLEVQGAREINLVAQDLAHWGRDVRDGNSLPVLLDALLTETSVPWDRLLYIYSAGLSPRMLDLIAREPRIARYLDIPMQHASDSVLARMRRPERKAKQRVKLRQLREAIPGVAIRTTVIVGFPGETDDEFRELLDFLEEEQLERVGAFTYSPQEGTRAWEMPDDVPNEVKRERLERVQELQRLVTGDRYESWIGSTARAMIDRPAEDGRFAQARIDAQADDIDGVTWVESDAPPGTILEVRLDEVVDDYDFRATALRTLDAAAVHAPRAATRALPIAAGSVGSFGR
ncbi:MAG: 30S ribosomal protein S12 methylthiotransferase RimO [Gemmatimonadaceae bacterium]